MLDVGDGAVRDPAFDDNGKLAEGQPELVKGIELEGKAGFDLRAATADLLDRHRLKDGDLAAKLAEDLNAPGIIPFVPRSAHPARL